MMDLCPCALWDFILWAINTYRNLLWAINISDVLLLWKWVSYLHLTSHAVPRICFGCLLGCSKYTWQKRLIFQQYLRRSKQTGAKYVSIGQMTSHSLPTLCLFYYTAAVNRLKSYKTILSYVMDTIELGKWLRESNFLLICL